MSKEYLLGALHDGTERSETFRIGQRSRNYLVFLSRIIRKMGFGSWIYREGKNRKLFVLEFTKSKLKLNEVALDSPTKIVDYVRGYFDAEGGIAHNSTVRFYIYFAQKNKEDLTQVRNFLLGFGIKCGRIHNPSAKKDPDYWRFYISSESYQDFARKIGSWHPVKSRILRMKI